MPIYLYYCSLIPTYTAESFIQVDYTVEIALSIGDEGKCHNYMSGWTFSIKPLLDNESIFLIYDLHLRNYNFSGKLTPYRVNCMYLGKRPSIVNSFGLTYLFCVILEKVIGNRVLMIILQGSRVKRYNAWPRLCRA